MTTLVVHLAFALFMGVTFLQLLCFNILMAVTHSVIQIHGEMGSEFPPKHASLDTLYSNRIIHEFCFRASQVSLL